MTSSPLLPWEPDMNTQEPRAKAGDWVYGLGGTETISHLATGLWALRGSRLPRVTVACGREYKVGHSTMCTRSVGEADVPRCENCLRADSVQRSAE